MASMMKALKIKRARAHKPNRNNLRTLAKRLKNNAETLREAAKLEQADS